HHQDSILGFTHTHTHTHTHTDISLLSSSCSDSSRQISRSLSFWKASNRCHVGYIPLPLPHDYNIIRISEGLIDMTRTIKPHNPTLSYLAPQAANCLNSIHNLHRTTIWCRTMGNKTEIRAK